MKKIIVMLSMILIVIMATGCEKQTEKPEIIEETVLEEQVLEENVIEETYWTETLYEIDGIKLNEYFIRMNYGDEVFEFIKYYTEEYEHLEGVNCRIGSFYTREYIDNEHYVKEIRPDCKLSCANQHVIDGWVLVHEQY